MGKERIIELSKRLNEMDETLTLKEVAELNEALGFELVSFPDFKYGVTVTNINHIG
jgi:hypothetical protein